MNIYGHAPSIMKLSPGPVTELGPVFYSYSNDDNDNDTVYSIPNVSGC